MVLFFHLVVLNVGKLFNENNAQLFDENEVNKHNYNCWNRCVCVCMYIYKLNLSYAVRN